MEIKGRRGWGGVEERVEEGRGRGGEGTGGVDETVKEAGVGNGWVKEAGVGTGG